MGYILIGADLVPTKSNIDLFMDGDSTELIGKELQKLIHDAEYRIFNLEVPLTDVTMPIDKQGPCLIAPTKTVKGYKALEVDLLTLANNHILDQGTNGLFSTMEVLDHNNISHVGAGRNAKEASKPFVFDFQGKKIGIYACTEHEFSVVTDKHAGANPYDSLEISDHISSLKNYCDYLIVLYHGGKEHYPYPSPALRKRCRKMAEKGADLVLCQHSHCIGCAETYDDCMIVYGQGNFLFDDKDYDCWQTGLLVKVDAQLDVSFVPVVKNGRTVRLAVGDRREEILEAFNLRSEEIQKPGFVEKSYSAFAKEMQWKYFYALRGRESIIFRLLNRVSGNRLRKKVLLSRYRKRELLALLNYIECEAHSELLASGIKDRIKGDNKE